MGLAPHGITLQLHARHAVEKGYGPVEDPQTALHLDGGLRSESPAAVAEVRRFHPQDLPGNVRDTVWCWAFALHVSHGSQGGRDGPRL